MTAPNSTVKSERPAKLSRWPKKWDPMYEQWVVLSAAGKSNKDIAELYNYTPQQVSNILTSPMAQMARRKIYEALHKGIDEGIPKRLEMLADKAVQRVAEVLYNDELAAESPFAVADRSIVVLKGLNKMRDETKAGNTNIERAIIMAPELVLQLRDGIASLKRAEKLAELEKMEEAEVVK